MKKIIQGFETLETILKGAKEASDLITSTMGPGGQLVCIPNKYKIRFTKDGATVAQNLDDINDPVESIGVKLITQASKDMGERVGDGSTTVVCLLYEMMRESVNLMRSGYSPNSIIEAMREFKKISYDTIESIHKTIDTKSTQMKQIATIAANGDVSIGEKLAEMFSQLGVDGMIVAEESRTENTYTEIKEGFYFNKGASLGFFKDDEQERMKIELDNPLILTMGQKLTSVTPLLPLIQQISTTGKPLVIIVDDIDNDLINTFTINRKFNKLNSVVVKADGFGDRKTSFLEDISIFTGSELLCDAHNNLNNISMNSLGTAKKIQITKDHSTIIGGNGTTEKKNQRVAMIKTQLEHVKSEYDKEKLQERLSKLTSGIGTIYVGGQTEVEIKEKKDRVEDAIHACKNAAKGGIVPGAGTELMYASSKMCNHTNIIVRKFGCILNKILKKIISNLGLVSPDVIVNELYGYFEKNNYEMGFNGSTGKISNLLTDGIINPKLVSLNALDIALSTCEVFVKLNGVIIEPKENTNKEISDSPYG